MFEKKEDFFALAPEDHVLLPVTDNFDVDEVNFSTPVQFLSMTFPDRSGKYAVVLSGDKAEKEFRKLHLNVGTPVLCKKVQLKHLIPVMMAMGMQLLLDPFGAEMVICTGMDMVGYCESHPEMMQGDLRNDLYLGFRISQAKVGGQEKKKELLRELAAVDPFFIVTTKLNVISPFVTHVSGPDMQHYIMIFSNLRSAAAYCSYVNNKMKGKQGWENLQPVKASVAQLLRVVKNNPDSHVDHYYLNDGHPESFSFSYSELAQAAKE